VLKAGNRLFESLADIASIKRSIHTS